MHIESSRNGQKHLRTSLFIPLGDEPGVYTAWRRAQCLYRLATNPVFIPLGGEPSVYTAWRRAQVLPRLAANPVFTSLGGESRFYLAWRRTQYLSRLAANLVFVSLGGHRAKKTAGCPAVPHQRIFEPQPPSSLFAAPPQLPSCPFSGTGVDADAA